MLDPLNDRCVCQGHPFIRKSDQDCEKEVNFGRWVCLVMGLEKNIWFSECDWMTPSECHLWSWFLVSGVLQFHFIMHPTVQLAGYIRLVDIRLSDWQTIRVMGYQANGLGLGVRVRARVRIELGNPDIQGFRAFWKVLGFIYWKFLDLESPGKSLKLKLKVLERPGKKSLKVMHFSSASNGKQAAIL